MQWLIDHWLLVLIAAVMLIGMVTKPRRRQHRPVMLPKGSPYVLGLAISAGLGAVFTYGTYGLLGMLYPHAFASSLLYAKLSFAALAGVGTLIAGLLLINGVSNTRPVPVGWGGVPLILSGRSWIHFLLPEGGQWGIPYIFEPLPVDMRPQPLVENPKEENAATKESGEEMETEQGLDYETIPVLALAKVYPPDVTQPSGQTVSPTIHGIDKIFEVPVVVDVVARIRIYDPFLYLGYKNAKDLLYASLRERVREFIRGTKDDRKDAFSLPDLKEEMTSGLVKQLDAEGAPMGVDFVKLFVTRIRLPKRISKEGVNVLLELVQRSKEKYQGETLAQTAALLKKMFPGLDDKELKNMVMTAAQLATTQAYSFEGQGPLPVVPLGNGKKGPSRG